MKKFEYIVAVFTENNGYCLECLAGTDFERAKKRLQEERERNPHKHLVLQRVPKNHCWWNEGHLD